MPGLKNILNSSDREEIIQRLSTLQAQNERQWGKMNVLEMVHHLRMQLDLALGEIELEMANAPFLRSKAGRKLSLGRIPWPKGKVKAPVKIERFDEVDQAALDEIRKKVSEKLKVLASCDSGHRANHPLFGSMDKKEWGRLTWKHFDHHLRQFGA